MGAISLERIDHLLWLGRYLERSCTTQRFIISTYDKAIDSTEGNWKGQLEELGFQEGSDEPLTFFRECLFDAGNPCSLAHSMGAALGNAVTMRDVLGSESIAYLQMGVDAVESARTSGSPLLDLQLVQDNIMAFKGCVDDFVADEGARNIIKCGMSVERIDLYARLSYRLDALPAEVARLASRIDRTGAPYDRDAFKTCVDIVFSGSFQKDPTHDRLSPPWDKNPRVFADAAGAEGPAA